MSIGLDAATTHLGRASSPFPDPQTWAACGWGWLGTVAGQDDAICNVENSDASKWTSISHNGVNGICIESTGSGGLQFFSSSPAATTWFFWYVASDIISHRGGWATPGAAFVTKTIGAASSVVTVANIGIGCYKLGITGTSHNMRHENVKMWTGTIPTDAQLQAEMFSTRPRAYANLYGWWPLRILADLADRVDHPGASGNDLSTQGSIAASDPGPPLMFGAGATAIGNRGVRLFVEWGAQAAGGGGGGSQGVPYSDETPLAWSLWNLEGGGAANVLGSASWGQLEAQTAGYTARPAVSDVRDTGDDSSKTIYLHRDRYGASGSGNVTISIRGSAYPFAQHAVGPSWETYTTQVTRSWRYVQVKVEYAA